VPVPHLIINGGRVPARGGGPFPHQSFGDTARVEVLITVASMSVLRACSVSPIGSLEAPAWCFSAANPWISVAISQTTFSGVISDRDARVGGLPHHKSGAGTLILTNANTYTGRRHWMRSPSGPITPRRGTGPARLQPVPESAWRNGTIAGAGDYRYGHRFRCIPCAGAAQQPGRTFNHPKWSTFKPTGICQVELNVSQTVPGR